MTAKEFLQRATRLDDEINTMQQSLDEMRSMAERVTASISAAPHGGGDDHSRENIIIKICDLNAKIEERIDELVTVKAEIVDRINQIQNANYRLLLWKRYIQGKRWEQIAVDMNYSDRQVKRVHGYALLEIGKRCHEMSLNVTEKS